MNWLPPVLYLVLLLDSVLGSLPAPVIVNVSSFNCHHVLHWVPGPGTPSGTCYEIIRRVNRKKLKPPLCSNETSLKLEFPDNHEKYTLTVQASYNQTLSPESLKYSFKPFTQTKIGPPKVSLAGCGNCIQINISLPKADPSSRIDDIKTFYGGSQFRVFWKIPNEAQESILTNDKSYTVNNLQPGTEYCVQVRPEFNVNRNTEPSAWNCTFTSIVAPSRDPYVLGAVSTLLPIVIGVLMTTMFCLYYTGFLCKLKETPRVLREALIRGSTLTPDRTIPDNISISAEMEKRRKHNNPTPATRGTNSDEEEEEEDEEDEGENVYMDRGAELSSAESSSQNSAGVSGNSKVAASGGSGSLTAVAEVPDTESEVEVTHGGLDHDEAKAKGEEVSFTPDGPVTGEVVVLVGDEEVEEEVYKSSGNINLFSVTLAALAVGEEGEEDEEQNERDSLTDFLKVSDLQPLLPADSQTESDDWTTLALMLPTQEDFTVNGYEGRRTNTSSDYLKTGDDESQHEETQEEEEEEEEEFSGYMRHT